MRQEKRRYNTQIKTQHIYADRGLEAEVTFTGQLCENMCNRGPIICIDDQVYEEVNLSLLHKILEEEFKC